MQDAGARRVSNAEDMRRVVRKHDCALPAQYTKHSNARGHSLRLRGSLKSVHCDMCPAHSPRHWGPGGGLGVGIGLRLRLGVRLGLAVAVVVAVAVAVAAG